MTEKTFDIQDVLKKIDTKQYDWFGQLTDKEKSQLKAQFIPLLRWLSAVGSSEVDFDEARRQGRKKGDKKGPWPSRDQDNEFTDYYLQFTNMIVNENFFALYDHPELQWKLMCIIGMGTPQKHQWIKSSPKTPNYDAVREVIASVNPLASYKEISMIINMHTKESFKELLLRMGKQDDEIKKLMENFKKMSKN